MCIAFILWQFHPRYRLYLALNRDEVLSRPTIPVHWWSEYDDILAGTDLYKGGTWFGCTRNGRIALVTSFREVAHFHDAISRGELVVSFLKGTKRPLEYAQEVSNNGEKYNGFNVLIADLCTREMAYVSNRPNTNPVQPQNVQPGFHVLCNASLNTPWPKVLRGKAIVEHVMEDIGSCEIPKDRIFEELLMDDAKAEKGCLPKTGYDLEWEHKMSPIFVNCISNEGPYGTRSMIVFFIDEDGQASLFEKFLEDNCWKEHEFCFRIPAELWKDHEGLS